MRDRFLLTFMECAAQPRCSSSSESRSASCSIAPHRAARHRDLGRGAGIRAVVLMYPLFLVMFGRAMRPSS